ncbi:MAG: glycosyltransferase family 4 protein [Trueperaceae bacterium]
MLRVVIVNYAHDPVVTDPDRTLEAFVALPEFASGLRRAGADVFVVQRYRRDVTVVRDGVTYSFVAGGGRGRPRTLSASPAVHDTVARLRPRLVHVNGLVFPFQTRLLRRRLGPGPALVVQHHGERPGGAWRGALQRWGLAGVDGFLFTADEQAADWRERGVIGRSHGVFEVMEGSTGLNPRARAEARERMPLPGAPAFLWVGRLHDVKDPRTMLAGFELLLRDVPDAHLTMVFGEADLIEEIEARLRASRRLRAAVTLVGYVPRAELPWYYGSADYFVAASVREGSGFALAEALACGAVPIVTDIPSFAKMTAGGRFGGLWRPGDAEDFARVARAVLARPHHEMSQAAAAHYRDHLSAAAIGRQALAAYSAVLAGRGDAKA